MRLPRWITVLAIAVTLFGTVQGARAAFGAIAYSPSTGSYGYWYGANCRAEAENGALNNCGGADRQIVVWVQNGWASLAVNNEGRWGYGWSTNCREEADRNALNNAGGRRCGARILCWVASGS